MNTVKKKHLPATLRTVPHTMSQTEYEKWYCTGYVTSIAKQLEEVFLGSTSRPIWPVAETEGKVLGRLKLLIYLLTTAGTLSRVFNGVALGLRNLDTCSY